MPVGMPARAAKLPLFIVDGNWSEARELATVTRVQGSPLERQMAVTILGHLACNQGDIELAWSMVQELVPRGPDSEPEDALFPYAMEILRLATRMALEAGDDVDARNWVQAHDRWLDWSGAVRGQAESHLLWAHLHWLEGDLAEAERRACQALSLAAEPRQPLVLLACYRFLGHLLLSLRRYPDAETHFDKALSLAEACAAPYECSRVLLGKAALLLETGRSKDVDSLLNEARDVALELDARPLTEMVDDLAARNEVAGNNNSQLTGREIEVLRLVAEGMTDAEVGERLCISPRTVGQHLRSIYNKLGVASRTQATRVAVQDRMI
jgi:ATP/maltotriose-dependent transcriptional regulator MalT